MPLSTYGHSDVGFVRENNEDSFLVDDSKGFLQLPMELAGYLLGI